MREPCPQDATGRGYLRFAIALATASREGVTSYAETAHAMLREVQTDATHVLFERFRTADLLRWMAWLVCVVGEEVDYQYGKNVAPALHPANPECDDPFGGLLQGLAVGLSLIDLESKR